MIDYGENVHGNCFYSQLDYGTLTVNQILTTASSFK